jgi:excisionase family DNA binding protein
MDALSGNRRAVQEGAAVNDLSIYDQLAGVVSAGRDACSHRADWPAGGIPPVLLTVTQAAAVLNVSRSLLYEILRCGELESIRIGVCRRIPRDALDDWVARQRAAQAPHGEPDDEQQ